MRSGLEIQVALAPCFSCRDPACIHIAQGDLVSNSHICKTSMALSNVVPSFSFEIFGLWALSVPL